MTATDREGLGARIWVADDDDEFRELVVEALREDGYEVVEARDGVELLTLLDHVLAAPRTRPDVIVTDVRMPRLSGLGVLEYLRGTPLKPPVLLVTGFFPESVGVLAKRLGAFGVLAKPCRVDQLRTAVALAACASKARASDTGSEPEIPPPTPPTASPRSRG